MRVRARVASIVVALVLAAALGLSGATSGASTSSWRAKVAPHVLSQTSHGRSASFLVVLASQADVSPAAALPSKDAKGRFVFDTLQAHAKRTQASIRALLDRLGVRYQAHWIVNLITVGSGDRSLVRTLASRSDVARIDVNDWVRSPVLPRTAPVPSHTSRDGIGW